MTDKCVNCGVKVVKVRWALGEQWVHDRHGQGRTSEMYEHCALMFATPSPGALRAQGPNTGIYK